VSFIENLTAFLVEEKFWKPVNIRRS